MRGIEHRRNRRITTKSCYPQMMTMLQNDVVSAVERYFTISEEQVEIRYIKENMTFLIKIPLKIDIQESYPGF